MSLSHGRTLCLRSTSPLSSQTYKIGDRVQVLGYANGTVVPKCFTSHTMINDRLMNYSSSSQPAAAVVVCISCIAFSAEAGYRFRPLLDKQPFQEGRFTLDEYRCSQTMDYERLVSDLHRDQVKRQHCYQPLKSI